ncbi:MAG: hypothetical protein WCC48_05640 [Anaeromyxobacteraceae bacterium]
MRSALFLAVFAVAAGRGGCDPIAPWDPCEGKPCGELCRACPPDAADCVETMVVKACDAKGECATEGSFTCEEPPPADPCAGLACGDECVIDAPCAPLCLMPSILGKCDPRGTCQPVTEMKCDAPPPPADPCAGRLCGEPCSTCDPAVGMMCPMVMMYCDAAGACGYAYPVCTTATR